MDKNRLLELAGVLAEGKNEYSDSADFTEDYMTVLNNVQEIGKIINTKKWDNWMKVTEENYSVGTVNLNHTLKMHFKRLKEVTGFLEAAMDKADQG